MKLKHISFYSYCLPLNFPLNMKGYFQKERLGIIIELIDDSGNKGYGEAAPFPGLHKESLAEVKMECKKIKDELSQIEIVDHSPGLTFNISPSLQFAFEWALLELLARNKDISPAYYLSKECHSRIKINTLLTGTFDEVVNAASLLKDQNPAAIKIKVGNQPVEDDIYMVNKVNKIFAGKVKLRFDANRKWSLKQAKFFGKGIKRTNTEYIEEPVNNPDEFRCFYEDTGIGFALDETLNAVSVNNIKNMTGLKALIVKPSLFSSIDFIKNWVNFAKILDISVVFSSAFESSIGLWSIIFLASAFGKKDTAHGLDTYRWLKQDTLKPGLKPHNFKIDLPDCFNSYNLNNDILKPFKI